MNHIYRLIWNHTLNAFVAVGELTKTRGKRTASKTTRNAKSSFPRAGGGQGWGSKLKGLITLSLLSTPYVLQAANITDTTLPTGSELIAGQATVSQSGSQMEINQTTDKAILNWQEYSIGQSAAVNYTQPSTSAISLNRVVGADASQILGNLTANGRVFLVNPNGILFGQDAQVDVNGLLATTADMDNDAFMVGNYNFSDNGDSGSVINQGNITIADSGFAALVAPTVQNSGVIQARLGEVVLGSAKHYTLDLYGDQLIQFDVTDKITNGSIANSGTISADGGSVLISAEAVADVVEEVINMDGIIEARSVGFENGEIILSGSEQGIVEVSGTLDASGQDSGQMGGTIKVLGNKVGLMDGTRIDVSGDVGGGEVLIGGNYQGKGTEQNAEVTWVGSDVGIAADALTNGDGGRVIVWADDTTRFYGGITARGGAESGDGGFVETSGKKVLGLSGSVDASASNGVSGSWLLDPRNVTIASADANGAFDSGTPNVFTPSGDDATVDVAKIKASLDAGTSVTITTGADGTQAGNIVFDSSLTVDGAAVSAVTLTLQADGTVTFNNAGITDTAGNRALNLTITSGNNGGVGGVAFNQAVSIEGNLDVTSTTGNISQTSALTVGGTSSLTTSASNATITLDNTSNNFTGEVTLNTNGATGNVLLDNGITDIVLAASSIGGNLTLTTGNVAGITDNGTVTVTGNLVATTDANNGVIDLGTTTVTGELDLTTHGTGNATVDNGTADIVLAASEVGGNLTLTTGNVAGITDNGNVTVTGNLVATTDANNGVIDLGTLAVDGTVAITTNGTGNATLVNDNGLNFTTSTVGGTLNAKATAGNITQANALVVTGHTTLTTTNADVTLQNANNDFSIVTVSAKDVRITDVNNIDLNASTLSGLLRIDAASIGIQGDITTAGLVDLYAPSGITLNGDLSSSGYAITLHNDATFSSLERILDTTSADITFTKITGSGDGRLKLLAAGPNAVSATGGNINGEVDVYDLFITGTGGALTGSLRSISPSTGRRAAESIGTSPAPHPGTFKFNGYRVVGKAVEGESKRKVTTPTVPAPQADPRDSLVLVAKVSAEDYAPQNIDFTASGIDPFGAHYQEDLSVEDEGQQEKQQ